MTYVPPSALVHVMEDVVVKRFHSSAGCEGEAQWYRRYPGFCPELVAVDGPDLVTRRYPVAWDVPSWRDAKALYRLLSELGAAGVHHRDVHLRNIVIVDGAPRLIDWVTAVEAPGRVSYDLYGEAAGIERPPGHVTYQCWTAPNRWSIREAWGVDVPADVD